MRSFEIFYADGSMVAGSTASEYRQAPDDGIQFVIVRKPDGRVIVKKALSRYGYSGVTKPGAWTDRENYDRIKASLLERSNLLVDRSVRPRRRHR